MTPTTTCSTASPTTTTPGTTTPDTTTARTDCAIPGLRDGGDANAFYSGPPSSSAGGAVSSGGDFDGDGFDDVLIGANGGGSVYLLFGANVAAPSQDLGTAAAEFVGADLADGVGGSVVFIGDMDGDGYDDIAAGAEGTDVDGPGQAGDLAFSANGADGAFGRGAVYLVLGDANRLSGLEPADAHSRVEGVSLQRNGLAMGDLDGDGMDDLVVSHLGSGLVNAGDLDCDGIDDLAVGAHTGDGVFTDSGVVSLFWGNYTGVISSAAADLRIDGDVGGGSFGSSLASGNLDGDAGPELIIGSNGVGGGAGRAYLFMDGFP